MRWQDEVRVQANRVIWVADDESFGPGIRNGLAVLYLLSETKPSWESGV